MNSPDNNASKKVYTAPVFQVYGSISDMTNNVGLSANLDGGANPTDRSGV